MITADKIPPEVVEAAARFTWPRCGWYRPNPTPGQIVKQRMARDAARAALVAGLTAWPRANLVRHYDRQRIILPLPQEDRT